MVNQKEVQGLEWISPEGVVEFELKTRRRYEVSF
jgi:hypothetical protein